LHWRGAAHWRLDLLSFLGLPLEVLGILKKHGGFELLRLLLTDIAGVFCLLEDPDQVAEKLASILDELESTPFNVASRRVHHEFILVGIPVVQWIYRRVGACIFGLRHELDLGKIQLIRVVVDFRLVLVSEEVHEAGLQSPEVGQHLLFPLLQVARIVARGFRVGHEHELELRDLEDCFLQLREVFDSFSEVVDGSEIKEAVLHAGLELEPVLIEVKQEVPEVGRHLLSDVVVILDVGLEVVPVLLFEAEDVVHVPDAEPHRVVLQEELVQVEVAQGILRVKLHVLREMKTHDLFNVVGFSLHE